MLCCPLVKLSSNEDSDQKTAIMPSCISGRETYRMHNKCIESAKQEGRAAHTLHAMQSTNTAVHVQRQSQKDCAHLDDDWDRKVHVVGVDEADSETCEACKCAVHCTLTQDLHSP